MATLAQRVGDLTRVGDGPVATVYSGLRDGVPVALKVFPKRFDKRTMSALTKELAVLTGLRRVPSILPVDAVDELAGGEPALRMELCARSLAQAVSRHGPLSPEDVLAVGRAVALALAAAHEVGILHGGMSPHNVLFRASGEPVLADLGVTLRQALARDPLHAIEFLPPETLRTGAVDERTDLYGLGALLHYALAGRTPHPGRLGEQPGERVLRILGEPIPAINAAGVPVALSTLVARLLATDPAKRPADASQVAAQLGDLLPEPPPADDDDFDDFALPAAPPSSGGFLPPEVGSFGGAPPPGGQPVPAAAPPGVMPSLGGPTVPGGAPPSGVAFPPHAPLPPPGGMVAPGSFGPGGPPPTGGPVAPVVPVPSGAVPPPVGAPSRAATDFPAAAAVPDAGPPSDVPPVLGVAPVFPSAPPVPEVVPPPDAEPAAPRASGGVAAFPTAPPVSEVGPPADAVPPVSSAAGGARTAAGSGAEFDDFGMPATHSSWPPGQQPPASSGGPAWAPAPPPPDVGDSPPAVETDFGDGFEYRPPSEPANRKPAWGRLATAGAALAGVVVLVLILLLAGKPDVLPTPDREPAGASIAGVRLELSPPVDRTDHVELSWHSSRVLDYAVVVAAEGKATKVLLAQRKNSMTVPVEPGRKYCFMIQGTDSDRVYESEPVPLRGATCRK